MTSFAAAERQWNQYGRSQSLSKFPVTTGQVEVQHPEDRRQKALGLTEWQMEEETERQCSFDGEIGILQLPSTRADAHGRLGGDRVRG